VKHRESSALLGLFYKLFVSYSLATLSLRSIASINDLSRLVVFMLLAEENKANKKLILGKQKSVHLQKIRIIVAKKKHQI